MYFYQIVVLIINYHFYYLVSRSDTIKKFCEKIIDNIKEDNAKIEKRLKEIEHAEEEIKKEKLQLSFKIKRLETEKQLLHREFDF